MKPIKLTMSAFGSYREWRESILQEYKTDVF